MIYCVEMVNSNDPNVDSLNYDDTYMVYFALDDFIYSVLMFFSTEVLTFTTEAVVMIVTNNTYPLFIRHILRLCSPYSVSSSVK